MGCEKSYRYRRCHNIILFNHLYHGWILENTAASMRYHKGILFDPRATYIMTWYVDSSNSIFPPGSQSHFTNAVIIAIMSRP